MGLVKMGTSLIDSATKLCAVFGKPVAHSLSPLIHNAAFRDKGLNLVYLAFEVDDIASAISAVRALGVHGVSVTIPHKVTVIEHLDEVDPLARRMGSVNTIVNRDGYLFGTSSDGVGMLRALADEKVQAKGCRALILGSGGAARACGFSLAAEGEVSSLTIVDLKSQSDNARKLSAEIGAATGTVTDFSLLEDRAQLSRLALNSDILLNCTPVGMHPNEAASVVPADLHRPGLVVFDAVYTPRRTRLLEDAASAGAKTVEGLGMFVHQAAVQFELWTGVEAPVSLMREVVLKALAQRESA